MSRLFDRLARDELALGVYIKGGPHLVSTLANAGFDFVRPDMMFSAIDWQQMEHIIRAAEAKDITPWVRVPSNPWFGGTENMQVAVDAARAFAIGAPVVQVSVASAAQVKVLLSVARDWHRSAAGEYPSTAEQFSRHSKRVAEETFFVPSIETLTSLADAAEIAALPGMRAIFIACTDLSAQLGHPFEYDHPDNWEAIDRVVKFARAAGIAVVANTGYIYKTKTAIRERVTKLYDHGVRIVMIQGAEFLLENFCSDMLADVRRGYEGSDGSA